MKISVDDIIAYLSCPRYYLNKQLNPKRSFPSDWVYRKKIVIALATDPEADARNFMHEKIDIDVASASVLKGVVERLGYSKKTWEVKLGKFTITHDGFVNQENLPVYIHVSSSEFKFTPIVKFTAMILNEPEFIIHTHREHRLRQKKNENIMTFMSRFMTSIATGIDRIKVTSQEIESNKHWIIKTLNKIKRGDFSSFNPKSCVGVVEVCPFYGVCWGV